MNFEIKVILQRVDETGTAPHINYSVQNITLDENNKPEQHLALNNFIMKKINVQLILLIGLIVNFISCKAQTLPLNTFMEEIPSNAYVKDLNNELPPYLGIYKAIYDGKEVTLYITKEDNKLTKVMNKH